MSVATATADTGHASTAQTDQTTTQATIAATTASAASASGIQEPWAKSWVKSDFSLDHSALERMPEHLKGLRPTLERQKSFEDVLTVLQNAQHLNGKKALAPLPPGSPPEVMAERKALVDSLNGVPVVAAGAVATAKDYGLTRPESLPEAQWNQGMADGFAAWAHKYSVSPAAAKEMIGIQAKAVEGQMAQQSQYEQQFWGKQQETFEATIRRDNIPTDRAAALVEKGAVALGLDLENEETKTFMKGADARLMAMRHAIAIGEDHAIAPGGTERVETNPAELANDARTNPANPLHAAYWNKGGSSVSRAAHDSAVERVNGWLQMAEARKQKTAGGKR